MKKLILIFLIVFWASPVFADQWCKWDGSKGVDCQSDSKGYISTPFPVSTPSIANDRGFYKVTRTDPTIGTDQIRDAEVWAKVDNDITLTWTVRDLTTIEIDQRDAGAMEIGQYWLWKVLIVKSVVTQAEAAAVLPQEVIGAYLARQRLEQ